MSEDLIFNGLDGTTGGYLLETTAAAVSAFAQDEMIAQAETQQGHVTDLRSKAAERDPTYAVVDWVDPTDLAEAGWGVIFAANADPGIRDALAELLDYRKSQATRLKEHLYREYSGPERGYRAGETKEDFLRARGARPYGAVNPDKMPYYLLLVGDPESIPYSFQYQLDVQYAVGRIHFDTLDEYARYARSVVTAEQASPRPRRATFFAVQNADDRATALSAGSLVQPLTKGLDDLLTTNAALRGWDLRTIAPDQADKTTLARLLGGEDTPALLFTASHGIGFTADQHQRQLADQGGLVCGDWPGPRAWKDQAIPSNFYLAADDVGDDARLLGLFAFLFACYGAGTPRLDDYPQRTPEAQAAMAELGLPLAKAIAPQAFVARLPQRLLGHPKGGALAVIGHVERALTSSFVWRWLGTEMSDVDVFQGALWNLLRGERVGFAVEKFNERYADLGSTLSDTIRQMRSNGLMVDDRDLANMWTANADARGFVVFGDPATRLVIPDGSSQNVTDTIAPVAAQRRETPVEGSPTFQADAPASAPAPELPSAPATQPAQAAPASLAAPRTTGAPSLPSSVRLEIEPGTGRIVLTTQPSVPGAWTPAVAAPAAGEEAFPLFGSGASASLDELRDKLTISLKDFADRLGTALTGLVADVTSLEVATYVSDAADDVQYDARNHRLVGAVKRQAMTCIRADGDTLVLVPRGENGEIDAALWSLHTTMVERAQANRAEMLRLVSSTVADLLRIVKPL